MDTQNGTPVPPSPTASPSDPLLAPLTRYDTTSSTGSGRPIPAGHWILNLSGSCPRCNHYHRRVKIHIRDSSTASSRIGDINCTNCKTLWLGYGTRNSTRISLLSANTILDNEVIEEIEYRSTLVQMVRSATAIAALSPMLSGIPEMSATGPSRTDTSRFPSQTRGLQPTESRQDIGRPGLETAAGSRTSSRPATQSTSARISKPAPSGARHAQSRIILYQLGRRIDSTFPKFKDTRLGKLIRLETYAGTPKEQTRVIPSSSPTSASTSHVTTMQRSEDNTRSGDILDAQSHNADVDAPFMSAAEAPRSPGAPDPSPLAAMTVEEQKAWLRAQLTAFKSQHKRGKSATMPSMVDTSTQLNWGEALPVSSSSLSHYPHELIGVGHHFDYASYCHQYRGSNPSLRRASLNISESQFSQNDTVVEGAYAPSSYLPDTLHREPWRTGTLRPRSLHSPALQHVFQSGANPRLSLDSVVAASVRSVASSTGKRTPVRR